VKGVERDEFGGEVGGGRGYLYNILVETNHGNKSKISRGDRQGLREYKEKKRTRLNRRRSRIETSGAVRLAFLLVGCGKRLVGQNGKWQSMG